MIASDGTDLLLRPASQRGRLKVYIGMSAGVGKSYRMLEEAHRLLTERHAGELVAQELTDAQVQLGEITGQVTSDDLLGRIFGSFCIGK